MQGHYTITTLKCVQCSGLLTTRLPASFLLRTSCSAHCSIQIFRPSSKRAIMINYYIAALCIPVTVALAPISVNCTSGSSLHSSSPCFQSMDNSIEMQWLAWSCSSWCEHQLDSLSLLEVHHKLEHPSMLAPLHFCTEAWVLFRGTRLLLLLLLLLRSSINVGCWS